MLNPIVKLIEDLQRFRAEVRPGSSAGCGDDDGNKIPKFTGKASLQHQPEQLNLVAKFLQIAVRALARAGVDGKCEQYSTMIA